MDNCCNLSLTCFLGIHNVSDVHNVEASLQRILNLSCHISDLFAWKISVES